MIVEGGLRQKQKFYSVKPPLLTIITVCLNAEVHIEKTILSVIKNKTNFIHYIIIDGGSIDKTLDIIKKYNDYIDYWISEKDNGIYDAMNKGAILAVRGSYILWLNSDDILIKSPCIMKNYDACFYSVQVLDIYSKERAIFRSKIPKKVGFIANRFPSIHHQGFIVKREVFIKYFYDLKLGLHSDFFLMHTLILKHNWGLIDDFFIEYRTGGTTDLAKFKKIFSYYRIAKKMKGNTFCNLLINADRFFKMIIRAVISRKLVLLIRRLNIIIFGRVY